MVRSVSPLRYPGGKTCLYELMADLLADNKISRRHYAEPFAGGCGLALALLYSGTVSEIHINDIDPSIWAFWHSALERTEELMAMIESCPLTIEEWRRQRDIHRAGQLTDTLGLGFATFYLNRTNRSGIIKGAGVIGGQKQDGNYKLDCRFNRVELINRIERVAKYKDRIHLTRLDALEFLDRADSDLPATTFLCIDPPYFMKGAGLYTSFYQPEDHAMLADRVLALKNNWIVTYDNVPEIRSLYTTRRRYEFDINYSLEVKRLGTELLVASDTLKLPDILSERQVLEHKTSLAISA